MKKAFSVLAALTVLLCAFTGCGNGGKTGDGPEAAEIWAEIAATVPEENLPVFMELSPTDLETYYGLTESEVSDFVVQVPMMNVKATEVLIARAQKGKSGDIVQAVKDRQALLDTIWSTYLPDQYQLVKDFRLVENGDWILFVIAEDADAIVEVFDRYTK